ncbi:hypothetical protein CEXT_706891 [Caerostris extrusa]|nr:hypothetical protein CEXT_706891 [Caerostris extrusa]
MFPIKEPPPFATAIAIRNVPKLLLKHPFHCSSRGLLMEREQLSGKLREKPFSYSLLPNESGKVSILFLNFNGSTREGLAEHY